MTRYFLDKTRQLHIRLDFMVFHGKNYVDFESPEIYMGTSYVAKRSESSHSKEKWFIGIIVHVYAVQ